MLFSVLIASFNNSRFLENALNSVIGQTYTKWEVILVDDCSTDEFEEIIKMFKYEARIKVYRNKKNRGCGYTKRRCARIAQGSVLAFLDPDDSLEPEALQILTEQHTLRSECSLIHSTHYICDHTLTIKRIANYPKPLPENTPYLFLSDGSIHAFASFKKSCYEKTSGISSTNKKAVDQDLYYKLEETGKINFVNLPLYRYRIHEGSISNFGKETETTIWHYSIIEEACIRRISSLVRKDQATRNLKKRYRTRYLKISLLNNFRKRNFYLFFKSLLLFCFEGGWGNIVSYIKKMPKEGRNLIRKTFIDTYKINS